MREQGMLDPARLVFIDETAAAITAVRPPCAPSPKSITISRWSFDQAGTIASTDILATGERRPALVSRCDDHLFYAGLSFPPPDERELLCSLFVSATSSAQGAVQRVRPTRPLRA
jgi:hypothetical protein